MNKKIGEIDMSQKGITKSYDQEFKSQAVKLVQEIGGCSCTKQCSL